MRCYGAFMDTNKSQALIDQAADYGSAAIQTLVEVMQDDWAKPADRVSAAVHLLERGHGKPIQPITPAPLPDGAAQVNQLTDAALLAIIAGARRTAVTLGHGPGVDHQKDTVGSTQYANGRRSLAFDTTPSASSDEGGDAPDFPGDKFEENAVGNFPAAPETKPLANAIDPASQILAVFRARQQASRDWPEHSAADPSEFPEPAAHPLLL